MFRPLLTSILSLALIASATPMMAAAPFGIQVIDEGNGRGIPMVTLTTIHGVSLVTDSAGWAAFDEPGLLGGRVYLTLSSPGYAFPRDDNGMVGTVVETSSGGTTTLKMMRLNIAERLYRVTGAGLYAESTLLGKEAPLPSPNFTAGILRQCISQSTLHDGRVFWIWQRTDLATTPDSPVFSAGATSDLPDKGGLDSAQGVFFRHFISVDEQAKTLLPVDDPGGITMDGLVSVKDAAGAAHLVSHYSRNKADGTRLEHGLAELNSEGFFDRIILLGEEYQWQFPQGHAVALKDEEGDWLYFATPFCTVRSQASFESLRSPASYQALTLDPATGKPVWQQASPPMTQSQENHWIESEKLNPAQARLQIVDANTKKTLMIRHGSVRWNPFRKRWLLLASGSPGTVIYAESKAPDGPWGKAVTITSHPGSDLQQISHHDFLDQEEGRVLYFEGTHTGTAVPRYENCQMMYRLDLNDARLGAAQRQ